VGERMSIYRCAFCDYEAKNIDDYQVHQLKHSLPKKPRLSDVLSKEQIELLKDALFAYNSGLFGVKTKQSKIKQELITLLEKEGRDVS